LPTVTGRQLTADRYQFSIVSDMRKIVYLLLLLAVVIAVVRPKVLWAESRRMWSQRWLVTNTFLILIGLYLLYGFYLLYTQGG
jgi:hypothetical protein